MLDLAKNQRIFRHKYFRSEYKNDCDLSISKRSIVHCVFCLLLVCYSESTI